MSIRKLPIGDQEQGFIDVFLQLRNRAAISFVFLERDYPDNILVQMHCVFRQPAWREFAVSVLKEQDDVETIPHLSTGKMGIYMYDRSQGPMTCPIVNTNSNTTGTANSATNTPEATASIDTSYNTTDDMTDSTATSVTTTTTNTSFIDENTGDNNTIVSTHQNRFLLISFRDKLEQGKMYHGTKTWTDSTTCGSLEALSDIWIEYAKGYEGRDPVYLYDPNTRPKPQKNAGRLWISELKRYKLRRPFLQYIINRAVQHNSIDIDSFVDSLIKDLQEELTRKNVDQKRVYRNFEVFTSKYLQIKDPLIKKRTNK